LTGLGPKLKALRAQHGLSQDQFCALLAEKPSKIRDIEAGRQRVNDEFLRKLIATFQVDLNWLFDAPGFAGRHGNRIDPPDPAKPVHGDFVFEGEEFALVERAELNLSAGTGLVPVDGSAGESIAMPRRWFLTNGVNSDLSVLVRVRGDSMAPAIPDGALVLLHAPELHLPVAGVYAFIRGEAAYIKRLIPVARRPDGRPASVVILSDNPAYQPETLSGAEMNDLRILGRVRCVLVTL
jgi:phage repressor protein C with HTH and peptisase S24 domain